MGAAKLVGALLLPLNASAFELIPGLNAGISVGAVDHPLHISGDDIGNAAAVALFDLCCAAGSTRPAEVALELGVEMIVRGIVHPEQRQLPAIGSRFVHLYRIRGIQAFPLG